MSFRKQLILMILGIVLTSIVLNTVIIGQVIDRRFKNYVEDEYVLSVQSITDFAKEALSDPEFNPEKASMKLDRYLEDLIVAITIYDADNRPVLQLRQNTTSHMMMERTATKDSLYSIEEDGEVLGYVLIQRYAAFGNTAVSVWLSGIVSRISTLSLLGTLLLSLLAILWVSKRLTRDLNRTAELAENIESVDSLEYKASTTREIQSIQKTLTDLARRLRIRQRLRKEKADRLAHEARTPLTILKSGLEAVRDEVVPADGEHLTVWLDQIDRLSQMLGDVGGILELDSEAPEVHRQTVDLGDLVRKVARSLKPSVQQRGLTLEVTCSGCKNVETDPALLLQSLYNVLNNAIKFTPSGGTIALSVKEEEGRIRLAVEDSGPGLDPSEYAQVFDAYRRGSNSTGISGQGMGLYLVRMNLEALDGEVHLTASPVGGLGVVMTIPR